MPISCLLLNHKWHARDYENKKKIRNNMFHNFKVDINN